MIPHTYLKISSIAYHPTFLIQAKHTFFKIIDVTLRDLKSIFVLMTSVLALVSISHDYRRSGKAVIRVM